MTQIRALRGYEEENPVSKQSYKRLIGWYDFPLLHGEERCCFQKENGNLCHEGHRHGFVALLSNESISIIGNNCAKQQFNAQDQIRIDVTRLENERRRREKLAALEGALQNEAVQRELSSKSLRELKADRARIKDFETRVGGRIYAAVRDMARNGNNNVRVRAKYVRAYIEKGEAKQEISYSVQIVGVLSGLGSLLTDSIHAAAAKLSDAEKTYAAARQLSTSSKTNEVGKALAAINDLSFAVEEAKSFHQMVEHFFQGDLALLSHLSDDRDDKLKAMRFALENRVGSASNNESKNMIAKQTTELLTRLGASSVKATN